jgi:hypothetical protein
LLALVVASGASTAGLGMAPSPPAETLVALQALIAGIINDKIRSPKTSKYVCMFFSPPAGIYADWI